MNPGGRPGVLHFNCPEFPEMSPSSPVDAREHHDCGDARKDGNSERPVDEADHVSASIRVIHHAHMASTSSRTASGSILAMRDHASIGSFVR